MRRALITLLQALENRTPLGPDVELHAATTQELAKLLRSSAPITAKQVRLVRRLDYRQQRQAGVLKASASGTKRTTRKVISKLAKPQAGMFRKKLLGKRAASSRVGLYALMVTAASKSSGSVSAQLFDDPGLRSVQFDTTSGNRNISGSFWQSTTGIQNCVYADLAPEQFASYVLGGAYDGDLAELQFSELRAVSVSTSLQIEGVSYSRGMNLVGKVSLPGNFARIFPPTLTIFGPFDPDARTTGSANLRTAPQFDLALGRWILQKCYLHI